MDELVQLTEREAERSQLATLNCRMLFRLSVPIVLFSIILAIALVARGGGSEVWAAIPLASLAVVRILYSLREHPFLTRFFRPILLGFLTLQLLSWRLLPEIWPGSGSTTETAGASIHPLDVFLPWIVLFFRLRSAELGVVLGGLWLFSSGRHLLQVALRGDAPDPALLVVQGGVLLAVFALGRTLTRRYRLGFLEDWRREFRRDQDRRRMQGELDDARRFQLAMLPRSEPAIPGLDVSGLSIPASEVGGDFYGYFPMEDHRCGLVVADVSGHGVASGLLLSGVRSCLHLLQETPMEPVEVLGRLDRMLRRIAQKRAFVTMVYTLWDDEIRRLEIASAGHPPVLCFRAATGEVEEVDLPALPLGTPIPGEFRQTTIDLAPGDVFLLHTDGIAETMNPLQSLYGDERLRRSLGRASKDPERTAKQIRDDVLSSLWSFKADGVQHDDVTLVVGRVRRLD